MPSVNRITLAGHVVRDPELRYTSNGKGVTNFTLAVNRDYGDEADYIRCTAWNRGKYKLAEYISENVKKGKLVTVVGRLQIDTWTDNEGNKRKTANVVAEKAIYERSTEKSPDWDNNGGTEDDFEAPF